MLLKWIDCRLAQAQREAFACAQAGWKEMQHEPGFCGQFGGWVEVPEPGQLGAYVLGLWKDKDCHQKFMQEGVHDAIVQKHDLAGGLQSWQVEILQQVLPMPGEFADLAAALAHVSAGAWLRAAECVVPPAQASAFWQAQEELWQPAMAAAPGMLGGCVAAADEKVMVFSLWASREKVDTYRQQVLPSLRAQCLQRKALPSSLVDRSFGLFPSWTIPPLASTLN